jgi:putative intracellular protease/amidase
MAVWSLDLLEPADVLADELTDVTLAFPNALLTKIGVSYFTNENVFAD